MQFAIFGLGLGLAPSTPANCGEGAKFVLRDGT